MKNDSKDTVKQPVHLSCMPLETSVFEEPTPLGGENENDVLPQETVLMVDQTDADTRIDVFLAQNTALTRASVHKRIAAGDVKCNGEIVQDKNFRLHPTDCVQLIIPPPQPLHAQAQNIPLQIVYEDDDLLVVNKPRGMVVHPAAGNEDGTLVNALLYHCAGRLSSINGVIRPGIVHRIDKDTSGLLLVAKNDMAHLDLAAQLKAHTCARVYQALATGNIKDDTGTIDRPIARHPTDRKKMAVCLPGRGRNAITHYYVRQRLEHCTYVECYLETGRTHQIRVHLASIGKPLVGDCLYGQSGDTFQRRWQQILHGQWLHARCIGFIHPRSKTWMQFEVPLPLELETALHTLGGKEVSADWSMRQQFISAADLTHTQA